MNPLLTLQFVVLGPPDEDGGSPVNMYEVGCTTPDNQTQEAYRGKETECVVNRLLPGRAYLFQIRAFSKNYLIFSSVPFNHVLFRFLTYLAFLLIKVHFLQTVLELVLGLIPSKLSVVLEHQMPLLVRK